MALGSCTVSIARPILNEITGRSRTSKSKGAKSMRTEPLMNFTYRQGEDGMMYPEVTVSENPQTDRMPVGRFGSRWKVYMMEKYPHRLSELVSQGRINEMILQVDQEAEREEGNVDPGTAGRPPHAGDGGHHGESRTYEHDNERSGRDRDGRSGAESQITPVSPPSPQNTKSSADGFRPSAGDFLLCRQSRRKPCRYPGQVWERNRRKKQLRQREQRRHQTIPPTCWKHQRSMLQKRRILSERKWRLRKNRTINRLSFF